MPIRPSIKLDIQSTVPMFQQLALALERKILGGILPPDQMLPSSRELATDLAIARGTVVRAYELLIAKGLVRVRHGKGYSVPSVPVSLPTSPIRLVTKPESALKFKNLAVEDITKAAPPKLLLPVKRWRELIIEHCRQLGETYYLDDLGMLDLRRAICRYLTLTRGAICQPEHISVHTNTDQALDTIARLLIRPGESVIVEEPGYIGVSKIFAAAGARIIINGIDADGMIIDNLTGVKTAPKALYTTPISQDPTGIVMSEARQKALIDWSIKSGCYIVEDSWDTDFWHGRPFSPCLQQMAPHRVIYLFSFWKLLFPLSNACFLIVPPELTPALRDLRALINRPPISLEFLALTDLLAEGAIDSLSAKLQKSYRKRRQALIYSLTLAFGKRIQIDPIGGGTQITVRFQPGIGKRRVLAAAAQCGLKMISLDEYYPHGTRTGACLIFFTNLSPATVGEQVDRFEKLCSGQK